MGTHFFNRHTTWTVFVSLLVALGLGACSDVSNAPAPPTPLSPDAKLSSLTVSSGTIQPVFLSDVTNYAVDVLTTITNVTVTAQAQNAGATVKINGSLTTSLSVTLGAAGSSTPISIVVTAPDGSQNTYIVTVNRAAPGGNNNLQSLTVSPGTLAPVFDASTQNYTVDVTSTVGSVTVTAAFQDPIASMTVNSQATNSGQARVVTLGAAGSSTPITIIVTAPNGTPKIYAVTVNRAAPGANNNLQSLTVSPGTLAPVFNTSTLNYTVDVATNITNVTVAAQAQDAGATVKINGSITTSLFVSLGAAGSNTPIPVIVTAPNGSQNTYIVNVHRAAPASDNNLSALSVTGQPFTFAAGTLAYTVDVATTVTSVTVSATKSDPLATMTGSITAGAGQATGQASLPLNGAGASTVVSLTVTAQNGTSSKTYTITVNRAAPSSDSNLSALSVTGQPFTFAAGTLAYTVDVATTVTSVTVSATKSDPNAKMTGSITAGAGQATGQASLPLNGAGTSTVVSLTVTAQNEISSTTYTITVNRAAPTAPTITTTSPLPSGTVDTFYSTTLSATGGTGAGTYTWTLAGDSPNQIPSGLTLSSTGVLSGTPTVGPPTAVGTHSLKFTVTDTTPLPTSATFSLTIN